jgi:hypothetical protein
MQKSFCSTETAFPNDLAEKATHSLARLGVSVKCGAMVQNVNQDGDDQIRRASRFHCGQDCNLAGRHHRLAAARW